VLVVNAAPRVVANTFRGYGVGVQVSARRRTHKKNAQGRIVGSKAGPVPAGVRPTCKGNRCEGGLDLFDERVAGGEQWREIYASGLVGMRGLRRLAVERAKGGDTVILATSDRRTEKPRSLTQHTLRRAGRKFVSRTSTVPNEVTARTWRQKWPERRSIKAEIGGRACRVTVLQTVLGQVWADGCNDTKPVHILLTAKAEGKREADPQTLLWASPRLERGHVLPAVADFEGDGRAEIVVATKTWCEGKGRVLVFAQERRKDAE
jgi:hypothetical protein